MPLGSFVLVLHGHLPYVLRHGVWPHGEDWLYEAAAETYLPVLETIGHCALHRAPPKLTLGLTPVLLEQLAHPHFKKGFEEYLRDRVERARADQRDFQARGDQELAALADRWIAWYDKLGERFTTIHRDIPGAYARHARDGMIEILTSAATHAYLPLLYEDASIRAQLRGGLASSHRILGFKPSGIWLPECAYRPGGAWTPPIPWGSRGHRIGIEHLVADEELTHFFVESRLVEESRSEWVFHDGSWRKVGWEEATTYPGRGWRSVNEIALVNSDATSPRGPAAFARDAAICEQVWSGTVGYPAHGSYLEFHKKHGERRGLRYWRVTSPTVGLGDKTPYRPEDIAARVHEHAVHFTQAVKAHLAEHLQVTGRQGVVVATFDAELFGHWWYEGPQFLRDVILTLKNDPDVDVVTAAEYLADHPPDKVVSMPEGSWGAGSDHRVWTNAQVNWMWDVEYRCESSFGKATTRLPWQGDANLKDLLQKAARELFLLQASDWPFVISRGQAVDYGIKRFMQHVGRFDTLLGIAEEASTDSAYLHRLSEVESFEIKDAEIHDIIFPDVDLDWWRM